MFQWESSSTKTLWKRDFIDSAVVNAKHVTAEWFPRSAVHFQVSLCCNCWEGLLSHPPPVPILSLNYLLIASVYKYSLHPTLYWSGQLTVRPQYYSIQLQQSVHWLLWNTVTPRMKVKSTRSIAVSSNCTTRATWGHITAPKPIALISDTTRISLLIILPWPVAEEFFIKNETTLKILFARKVYHRLLEAATRTRAEKLFLLKIQACFYTQSQRTRILITTFAISACSARGSWFASNARGVCWAPEPRGVAASPTSSKGSRVPTAHLFPPALHSVTFILPQQQHRERKGGSGKSVLKWSKKRIRWDRKSQLDRRIWQELTLRAGDENSKYGTCGTAMVAWFSSGKHISDTSSASLP